MKYKLTNETKKAYGVTLHRIECVTAFADVKVGDKGGWIEKESNLSQVGDARVYDNARVYDDAEVYGDARVYDDAEVYGDAWVCGNARVCSTSDYITIKNAWTSNRTFTFTKSNKMWRVGCFYGTGKELIEKAYKDSKLSGDCYKATVEYVEKIYQLIGE